MVKVLVAGDVAGRCELLFRFLNLNKKINDFFLFHKFIFLLVEFENCLQKDKIFPRYFALVHFFHQMAQHVQNGTSTKPEVNKFRLPLIFSDLQIIMNQNFTLVWITGENCVRTSFV